MVLTGPDEILGTKRKLVLELTYACNSACTYCCSNSYLKKRNSLYMNFDTAKKPIDQALLYNIDYLLLTGGEPTLVPSLPKIVEYAHSNGMRTRVNTNGWKNDSQYWKNIKDKGLDSAVVSIDYSHNSIEMNEKPVPLEAALETLEIMIDIGIETVVPIIPSMVSQKYDAAFYEFLRDYYRRFGATKKMEGYTELSMDDKRHYISWNSPLNYNGRTGEILFPDQIPCPSKIDLENSFFIRVNHNNEVRTPCGSYQQLKIRPYLFNPEDNESLIRGIRRLQSNQEFLEFLKTGKGLGENDVCDFCIREYLNK